MKRNLKTSKKILVLMLAFILSFSAVMTFTPKPVEAATAFKAIKGENPVKVGTRYFKVSGGKIYYSSQKNSGYKAAKFSGSIKDIYTNGNIILTIEDRNESYFRFSCYKVSEGKYKLLAKLSRKTPYDNYGNWWISTVYGNNVFFVKVLGYGQVETYLYNLTAKTLKLKKTNCDILARNGNCLITTDSISDTTVHKVSLYKTDSMGGMKALKCLGKRVSLACFINGEVYYAKYPDSNGDYSSVTIYKCSKSGTNVKKLAVLRGEGNDVEKLTATYVEYWDYDSKNTYRYYYATNKTVLV